MEERENRYSFCLRQWKCEHWDPWQRFFRERAAGLQVFTCTGQKIPANHYKAPLNPHIQVLLQDLQHKPASNLWSIIYLTDPHRISEERWEFQNKALLTDAPKLNNTIHYITLHLFTNMLLKTCMTRYAPIEILADRVSLCSG